MLTIQSAFSEEALVYEDSICYLYIRASDTCRETSPSQARRWINSHGDLRSVNLQSLQDLKQSLGNYADRRAAMRLALYAIDPSLSANTRTMAVEDLAPLIGTDSVLHWLEDLFFVQALEKQSIDIAYKTIEIAKDNEFHNVTRFYQLVLEHQKGICDLSGIWDQIEGSNLFAATQAEIFDSILGTGLFKRIVIEELAVSAQQLAQAVTLKANTEIDFNIRSKVVGKAPLEIDGAAKLIGLHQALIGVSRHAFWENVAIGKTKFVIAQSGSQEADARRSPAKLQELLISIEGGNDFDRLPKELFEIAEAQYNEELTHSVPQFTIDPDLAALQGTLEANNAFEKIKGWGRKASKGICRAGTKSFGSFLIGKQT